ncbi:MAG: S-layer homology domain-containing protein [Oscillospiraceae bacterium]
MKKSRKLLCALLTLVMVVSLLPVMAFAADEDVAAEESVAASVEENSPETAGVITDALGNIFTNLPNYLVVVKTPWGTLATGAQVVLYNQNKDEIVASAAATYGVAVFAKKDRRNAYSLSATWEQKSTGIQYKSIPQLSLGKLPDLDIVTVYPTFRIGLKDTDHDAYVVGYDNGYVGPNDTLTRAEAAQVIYALMTDESKAQYANKAGKTFVDVSKDHWAYEAITMMTKASILVGTGDGKFDPDATMTREQFATMIAQLFKIEVNQPITGYIFKDLNGGFADKYISLLYAMGILEGKGDNTFGPKESLTRAQAIVIVNKLIGRLPGKGTTSFGAVADQMKTWPDNMDTTTWYYADVQEATNSHDYALDVNFNTLKDLKGDFFQNLKHPITERWTAIK